MAHQVYHVLFPLVQENDTPSSFFHQVSSQCPSSNFSSIGLVNKQIVLMRKNRRKFMDKDWQSVYNSNFGCVLFMGLESSDRLQQ
jgi:hypothetical protein